MCCSRFADALCGRKKRGLAIVPVAVRGMPLSFMLCFRSLNVEHSNQIVGMGGVPVSTASMVGIGHCPWCGANLQQYYRQRLKCLPVINMADGIAFDLEHVFASVANSEDVERSNTFPPS
jgi:hypothetical protein